MDIFSHGLWTGAVYKIVKKKSKREFNIKKAVFWGLFPDIFAFSFVFIWLFINLVSGQINFSNLPNPKRIEPPINGAFIYEFTNILYSISHSMIIFFFVFLISFLIYRRPIWEMGGWLLHIFLDIPTHSYKFYPTPFLWPISDWKFNGISWGTPWFLILNYLAILIVYFIIFRKS